MAHRTEDHPAEVYPWTNGDLTAYKVAVWQTPLLSGWAA